MISIYFKKSFSAVKNGLWLLRLLECSILFWRGCKYIPSLYMMGLLVYRRSIRVWLLPKHVLNCVFFSLFSATCLCMALGTYFLTSVSFFVFGIAVSLGWCSQAAVSFVCILLISLSQKKKLGFAWSSNPMLLSCDKWQLDHILRIHVDFHIGSLISLPIA